jgi:hypothetical protein
VSAALFLLAALVLVAVPIFLRRPTWAVFTFAFLLLLHANLVLSSEYGVGLADPLLFGAMLGLAAVYPLLHGDTGHGLGRFLFACGLWVSAVLNSYLWSTAAGVSLGSLQAFLPNLLYALVLLSLIADRDRLVAALWGVVAATALLSTLTVLQVGLGLVDFSFFGLAQGGIDHIAGRVDAIRPTGPVRDPNYYCQILIPASPSRWAWPWAVRPHAGGRLRWLRSSSSSWRSCLPPRAGGCWPRQSPPPDCCWPTARSTILS